MKDITGPPKAYPQTYPDSEEIKRLWLIYEELCKSKSEVLNSNGVTFMDKVEYIRELAEARHRFWCKANHTYPNFIGKSISYRYNVGFTITS